MICKRKPSADLVRRSDLLEQKRGLEACLNTLTTYGGYMRARTELDPEIAEIDAELAEIDERLRVPVGTARSTDKPHTVLRRIFR